MKKHLIGVAAILFAVTLYAAWAQTAHAQVPPSANQTAISHSPSTPLPDHALAPRKGWCRITVRYGETLSSIAKERHVNWRILAIVNGKNRYWANHLREGDRLWAPCLPGEGKNPTPPSPTATPQMKICLTYKVKPFDSLLSVAVKFDVSRVRLARANALSTEAWLYEGQWLNIPCPQ